MKPFPPRRHFRPIFAFCMAISLMVSCSLAQTSNSATTATQTPPASATCAPTRSPGTPIPPPTQPPLPPCPVKRHTDTSISLGTFTQLTIGRTQEFSNSFSAQNNAPSAGTLGTLRQTFSPWLGYSVNLGYGRLSEHYFNGLYGTFGSFNVGTNMYESSITYIAHTRVNKRYSLFGDAGPGLLTFLPVPGAPRGFSVQVRPTGVFGSGVDLHLSRQFDLRAEYRGLVYNNPDFRTGDTLSKLLTLTSEPTISLVYHLRKFKPQEEFPNKRTPSR